MKQAILAIDQGTTSTRAIVFDAEGKVIVQSQKEFTQLFPQDGWVEHDPDEIWSTTLEVCRNVLAHCRKEAVDIAAVGITNQRETTLVWDRQSGRPLYNAIVWQDRRTSGFCEQLKQEGHEVILTAKTGLLADPYFSATKIRWILNNVEGARQKADKGELAFGTIDSYLLYKLTGGKTHATDATNASRTALFNIHTQQWDAELLEMMDVPESLLPKVMDSSDDFGKTDESEFGAVLPICGVAGDQQAALVGQACFHPGMIKSTYGTGCFMMQNTGDKALASSNRLLTTIAYRLDGKTTYALEGSIFIAGAAMQWVRDKLRMLQDVKDSEEIAKKVGAEQSVYLVPAFTGLGAPHWNPEARGALLGLTRDTGIDEIVTAGLQSVCYQTRDLIEAMRGDGADYESLRVDGGMVKNNWLMQFLADITNTPVVRPFVTETTALGAAYLAGLKVGVYKDLEEISSHWQNEMLFESHMPEKVRERLYGGWLKAVSRVND